MRKYEELAANIIENVGGKKNINALTHCITRLRFQLKDESKANDTAIKNMDGVVTLIKSAGQYQVVIGNHVPDVYAEVCLQAGITGDAQPTEKKKLGVGATIIDFISATMAPILAVLTASGMLKGVLSIASFAHWMDPTGGIYTLLSGVADAIFMFFPVALGFTTAKKLKIDPILGIAIGAGLMYPTLQNVDLNIFGRVINVSYQSTVLPVILTTILASWIYKKLMKVIPDVIKTFVVPMITLLIAVPLGFIVIGPLANSISDLITKAIMAVYGISPIAAGILMGAGWQLLVILGIHWSLVAVGIVQLASGQPTPIFSLCNAASFAQTAVVFAIWLKTKDKKLKNLALPAWISGIFGVTEPAIYGITLPRVKYFVVSCIGAAVGGAYAGATGLLTYQMAGLGIFGVPGFLGPDVAVGKTIMNVVISLVLAMGIAFVLTFIMYKDDNAKVEEKAEVKPETVDAVNETAAVETAKSEVIAAPVKGSVLPLSEAQDEAFSLGAMGDGVVVVPEDGKLYAPVDGTITTLFNTLHAIGITSENGSEILIHVGMDTVRLNGEGFKAHVAQDEKVKKGQLILEFDIDFIKEKGYSVQTPIILTNSCDLAGVTPTQEKAVNPGDKLISVTF